MVRAEPMVEAEVVAGVESPDLRTLAFMARALPMLLPVGMALMVGPAIARAQVPGESMEWGVPLEPMVAEAREAVALEEAVEVTQPGALEEPGEPEELGPTATVLWSGLNEF